MNLKEVTEFEWDSGNFAKSYSKHNVGNFEAEEVFFNQPLVLQDPKHSLSEDRFWALGETAQGRLIHVTFTYRNKKLRIISARPMSKHEREIYEKAKKNTKF